MDNVIGINRVESPLSYALRYAAMGYHVFPCHTVRDGKCSCGDAGCKNAGKHPFERLVRFGQSQATVDPDTIRRWWGAEKDANIGIHLAKSKKVAIDIDPRNGGHLTFEALEDKYGNLASDVMAYTGGGGEHHIFELPDNIVSLPGKLGKGVDLKMHGYIIAEPSLHASGNQYHWEASSSPLEGAIAPPLPDLLRSMGHAGQQPYEAPEQPANEPSGREVEELQEALPFIPSDDRDTWLRVGMALHNLAGSHGYGLWLDWSMASTKFDSKDSARVWRSFRRRGIEGVTLATVFKLAYENGWSGNGFPVAVGPVVFIDNADDNATSLPSPAADLSRFPVPILNEIVEWVETFTDEPVRSITMQGVIALVSVLGGRIYISSDRNDSSLYLMLLAGTGVGKGYAPKAIKIFLTSCGLSDLVGGSGNTSSAAVFSALRDAPCHVQVIDEVGKALQAARKQNNGMMAEAHAFLTECYSSTDSTVYRKNYSTTGLTAAQRANMGSNHVIHPSITLYSFATPEQVFNNLTTADIDDGFLNRQVLVMADDAPLPERERHFADIPKHFVDWAKLIRRKDTGLSSLSPLIGINTAYDLEPSAIEVRMSPEAKAMFKALKKETRGYGGDKGKLSIRWNENAQRMATGFAVASLSDIAELPEITPDIAQWCIEYMKYHGNRMVDLCELNIADSDVHRLRNQVLSATVNAGKRGRRQWEYADLCRLWKSSTMQQRDNIFNSLINDGLIVKTAPEKKPGSRGYAPTKAIYISTKFIEIDD